MELQERLNWIPRLDIADPSLIQRRLVGEKSIARFVCFRWNVRRLLTIIRLIYFWTWARVPDREQNSDTLRLDATACRVPATVDKADAGVGVL